ncbi:unnamed protein product [Zymoseptoria tritici ST99CH_1A5]|uniref:F-box domain-containing protein n=1 Tax=Zymoseptoria tritici ST99CH_1A5 TaxID=1276529 RepID=A0A1Y6LU08_ZYMTR|nr:unnamed protein product [Zymoseptoria tritici ST99CH_1A5]
MNKRSAPTMDAAPPSPTMQPSPTSTSMTSAASNVFGTAELLELILLDVDMRTLLLSQRVSRDFNNAITSSPSLQEKLFFRVKRNTAVRGEDPGKPQVNSLFLAQDIKQSIGLNSTHVGVRRTSSSESVLDVDVGFRTLDRMKELQQKDRKSSWQRMLVVQPLSWTGDIWGVYYTPPADSWWTTWVCDGRWADAMTMGELLRTMLKRAEAQQMRSRFKIMQQEIQECRSARGGTLMRSKWRSW